MEPESVFLPTGSTQASMEVAWDPAIIPEQPPLIPTTLTATGRPQRHYRIPARYNDVPPDGPAPTIPITDPEPTLMRRVILHVRDHYRTGINQFGLLREYLHRPSYDPDFAVPLEDLSNFSPSRQTADIQDDAQKGSDDTLHTAPWPFKNMTIYRLMEWLNTGSSQKSMGEVDRLVRDVIRAEDFRVEELQDFSAQRENKRFDDSQPNASKPGFGGDGWDETEVTICVPNGVRDGNGLDFSVPGLHYRRLLPTIKAALSDATSQHFHLSPFQRIWRHPSGLEERVFDEVYTADAWINAHDTLQKQRNEPGCKLEKVILGLMFWSDSTHLASFGTASVWPLYMYFANLSKYFRSRPGSAASHHVAYIPSVCHSAKVC